MSEEAAVSAAEPANEPAEEVREPERTEVEEEAEELGLAEPKPSKRKRWLTSIIVIVVILGALTGYFRWYQPIYAAFSHGSIALEVREDNKFAVADAKLAVDGKEYTTDGNGKVDIPSLVSGSYTVSVSKDGYDPASQQITVHRGANDLVIISIHKVPEKLYTLSGFVKDYVSDGNVVNAQITVGTVTQESDPNGGFSFANLASGAYKITISKSGYQDQVVSVAIGSADVTGEKIELVPIGQLVFVSNRDDGKRALYVTNYDGSNQHPFVDPQNDGEDFGPQISPDNKWVVFSSTRDHVKSTYGKDLSKLYIADRDGQNLKKINDDVSHTEVRWLPNSRFVYFTAFDDVQESHTVHRFYDTQKGTVINLNEDSIGELNFNPDGNSVVYTVAVYGADGSAQYTNYLKYFNMVTGDQETFVTKVGGIFSAPQFSADGKTITYDMVADNTRTRFQLPSTGGAEKQVPIPAEDSRTYYTSPDGKWKAFIEKRDGKEDVYVVDKDGANEKRLTSFGVASNAIPVVWDESSQYLTFAVSREAENAIYIVALAGGDPKKVTDFSDSSDNPPYY